MYRILLIDDDRELLKMLGEYLSMKGYEILTAESGREGMEKIAIRPDLILLDINMPGMDGLEVLRQVRDVLACPILFLTARAEEQDRVNGLLMGGDDYILKPFSLKELEARIQAHLKREERRTSRPEVKFSEGLLLDYGKKAAYADGKEIGLTRTEYEIVEFLSRNSGMVFEKERIYQRVLGYDGEGDSRNITELVRRIREKFAEAGLKERIETVWGMDGIPMEKLRDLSIRKTILLYMAVNFLVCTLLVFAVKETAGSYQSDIWRSYLSAEDVRAILRFSSLPEEFKEEADEEEALILADEEVPRIFNESMTEEDAFRSEVCDFIQTWSGYLIPLVGSCLTVFLFYRKKLRRPLAVLEEGTERIRKNDLDFSIDYQTGDELGRLCAQFERMRKALAENNRRTWKAMEEERVLRSAMTHDIRSPLAILKGYQEMLLEFLPEGRISLEREMEILESGMGQMERMEKFLDTMRALGRMEERKAERRPISLKALSGEVEKALWAEEKRREKAGEGRVAGKVLTGEERTLFLDQGMVLEAAENLISNAFRYAKSQVVAELSADEGRLLLTVTDDGPGFQGKEEEAAKAFYHANPKDDLSHFGLGLYLARMYCEKHGGKLMVGSKEKSGGVVTAVFLEEGTG